MRFGIMAMQLGLILPAGGDASPAALREQVARFDVADLVSKLADAGFKTVELNTELELFLPDCYDEAAVQRLGVLKQARGLNYTVHLPLWALEPSMPERRVREAAVATLVSALRRTAPLAPEVYVLHTTGPLAAEFARMPLPPGARDLVLAGFSAQARATVAEIIEQTGVAPRRLALENVEFPMALPLSLAEEFGCSLCLDTGHLLAGYSGERDFAAAVERTLPRLAEVHLHDGYLRGQGAEARVADHIALGKGDLKLEWLLKRLTAAGFAGPLVLELSLPEALASLQVVEAMLPGVSGA